MHHPKGWNSQKARRPGYVKNPDAVKQGVNRNPVDITALSAEEWQAKGWKPAPVDDSSKDAGRLTEHIEQLKRAGGGTVFLPAKIKPDGTVENIVQARVEYEGPRQGHWAVVDGKRRWIEGQHCYNRQLDPHSLEHVNKTVVMNKNPKLVIVGTQMENPVTGRKRVVPTNELDPEARMLRLGRTVHVKHADGWDGMSAKAALRAAAKIEDGTAKFLAAGRHE